MNRTAIRCVVSLLCVSAIPVSSQATRAAGSVAGIVTDSATLRPIQSAQITLSGSDRRVVTGTGGRFVLSGIEPGSYTLDIRRIGYAPRTIGGIVVLADKRTTVDAVLSPSAFQLSAVAVAPGSFSFLEDGPALRNSITRTAIQNSPFGEDVFRAVGRLPGLSSGDYGAQFSIRGGRPDETLVLLDGLELYEPFHLKDFAEGAISIIDVEAIDGVELLTGGFSAHYGDKRSGVMNIKSRVPRDSGVNVSTSLSLLNAGILAEGTFRGRRGSWLTSARSGFAGVVLGLINKKETKAPGYQDAFATVRYAVHPRHELSLSVLHAADRYQFAIKGTTGFRDSIPTLEAADNRYGNSYLWLTAKSLLGDHVAVRTLASTGRVSADRFGDEHHALAQREYYGVDGHRSFTLNALRQDYSFQNSERVVIDWGFDWRSLHADYSWENRVTQNPDDPTPDTTGFYPRITRRLRQQDGTTLAAYLSARVQVASPLTLEVGVRQDNATYSRDKDTSPRLNALFRVTPRTFLRAGWGQYRQRQGIADENAFDRLDRYFPSERTVQRTVGIERRFAAGGSLRVELYDKVGSRLRPIARNWKSGLNVFPESSEDRFIAYPDSSFARGLEVYLDRNMGARMSVRGGYALAKVEETLTRIQQVNDPLSPPFVKRHAWPQDQRHALNVDLSYRPGRLWTVTGGLTAHSGWPYTDERGVQVTRRNGTTDLAIRPDTLYGKRLPFYQRFDLRVTRRKVTPRGEFRFYVEAINLTNHENVLGYDTYRVRSSDGVLRVVRDPETWFSILPSLGFSWSRRF